MKSGGAQTPMMAQYLGIKAKYPGCILLFRMGDFYETFFEDAELISRILGITLTSRERKGEERIPLAGVPYHALEHYLAKLMDANLTVAICEQMEDPSRAKGLVKRDVVEIISPGTITNPSLLRSEQSSFLLALVPEKDPHPWGYALLDGSTGEFSCGECPREEALGLTRRYGVQELILAEGLPEEIQAAIRKDLPDLSLTFSSALLFQEAFGRQVLLDHFRTQGLEGLGVADLPRAVSAAGAALRYLTDRQRSRPEQVHSLQVERQKDRLHIDRESISHLELFESLRPGDRQATLFHHLDECRSPMGKRCLARWLRAPLCSVEAIESRLDCVQWLMEKQALLGSLRDEIKGIGDLERIAGRIATGRVMPHELVQLREGLSRFPRLRGMLREDSPELLQIWSGLDSCFQPWISALEESLCEETPNHLRSGGIIREGFDGELDDLRDLTTGGKRWILEYQERERQQTGITSLKVSYNKVFGYYLEVTHAHLSKVPSHYEEKQTLANSRRYMTAELKDREQEILSAEERKIERETQIFHELVDHLREILSDLHILIEALSRLDVMAALAWLAYRRDYVRPQLDDGPRIEIREGRHPVIERLVDEPFIPNDILLDRQDRQILLLTGPNMGGKSTYLRQTALFVIMAQMGSFLPAKWAHIGLVDRLFTRVGASDNLARGQSTFLVEMAETANILRNATDSSLVIFDEVGRGTSTQDGFALARAITEYLHDGPIQPKTLFATHFHELTSLEEQLDRCVNVQMQVREWEGKILFLHKVIPGASDRSYGVHVAKLAGIPRTVLERAMELLENESILADSKGMMRSAHVSPQLPLFQSSEREILHRLKSLSINEMSPLQALQILADMHASLDSGDSDK